MSEIRIKVKVRTNMVGSQVEGETSFDREDWESMSDAERDQAVSESVWDLIEWDYEVEGGE